MANISERRLLAPRPLERDLLNPKSQESREPSFTAWGGNLGRKPFRRASRPTRVRDVCKKLTLAKISERRLLAPRPLERDLCSNRSQESREPSFTAWGGNLCVKSQFNIVTFNVQLIVTNISRKFRRPSDTQSVFQFTTDWVLFI